VQEQLEPRRPPITESTRRFRWPIGPGGVAWGTGSHQAVGGWRGGHEGPRTTEDGQAHVVRSRVFLVCVRQGIACSRGRAEGRRGRGRMGEKPGQSRLERVGAREANRARSRAKPEGRGAGVIRGKGNAFAPPASHALGDHPDSAPEGALADALGYDVGTARGRGDGCAVARELLLQAGARLAEGFGAGARPRERDREPSCRISGGELVGRPGGLGRQGAQRASRPA